MGYFDDADHVEQYARMAEGYEGHALVELLKRHAKSGASVLELGMGPGRDLELLKEAGFHPTGSDSARTFLDYYARHGGTLPTLVLDAVTLHTDARFDVIYSNKVLQHLTREQCAASLLRQAQVVRPGGWLLHTLWYGEGEDRHHGLLFTKYTEQTVLDVLPPTLILVEAVRYTEMEAHDSLLILLRSEDGA